MPTYSQDGEFRSVAYITGPTHTLLQVAFSPTPVSEPLLVVLPAIGSAPFKAIDPQEVCRAVVEAIAATNAELGTAFFAAAIRYVEDDSPRYSLFAHCAALLVRRLAGGEPFTPTTVL